MKHSHGHRRIRMLKWIGALAILAAVFSSPSTLRAEICGLSLDLFTDQDSPEYPLGSPVKVMLVIKNNTGFGLNTTKGFAQVELHKGLTLTTPSGERRLFVNEDLAFDMPPPFFIKDLVGVPAETLSPNWVRTVTIEDLRELFPIMRETPGWYTIEARQEFVRYLWTIEYGNIGLIGVDNDPNTCRETVASNRIQIYVVPESGAQLQVRVLDGSSQLRTPLGQVPVKVFKGAIATQDFSHAWNERESVLYGTTDFEGKAFWGAGTYCLQKPEQQYTAIALYGSDFRSVPFMGVDEGWSVGCGGVILKEIIFRSQSSLPNLQDFSLLASNSILVKAGAVVESGHIGVLEPSPGHRKGSEVEVSIVINARVADKVQIFGDRVKLWPGASIDDIYYNDLQNDGEIRGNAVTPLDLPLSVPTPQLPSIRPGTRDYSVLFYRTRTLTPGEYRNVSIGFRSTLRLKAGIYHFKNLYLGYRSELVCLGPGSTEIRIKQRMYLGYRAKIGPLPNSGLNAKDVVFYIEGTDENLWDLFTIPRAADIGLRNEVEANMVVPNGTIWIDSGSNAQGSFIAKGVVVGVGSVVRLESGFDF